MYAPLCCLAILTEDGESVIHTTVERKISGIYASDVHDAVYLQYDNSVERITLDGVKSVSFTGNLIQVCEFSGEAVLCFPGGAYAADFR